MRPDKGFMFIVMDYQAAAVLKSVEVVFLTVQERSRQQMACLADRSMSIYYFHLHRLCKQQRGIKKIGEGHPGR